MAKRNEVSLSVQTLRSELTKVMVSAYGNQKHSSFEPFGDLQLAVAGWIVSGDFGERELASYFDAKPDLLLRLCRVQRDRKVYVQTRTWAKCAAGLLISHPELKGGSAWRSIEAIRSNRHQTPKEALAAIASVADGYRDNAEQLMKEAIEQLAGQTADTRKPTELRLSGLSDQLFSDGLREELARLYGELKYLTVEQVEAIEATLHHPRHWVEGPAGSGKTILAIEAVYRARQAGNRCVVVYRSSQFRHILGRLLDMRSGQLALMSHVDFSLLTWELERRAAEGDADIGAISEYIPWATAQPTVPPIDLLVIDDFGVAEDLLRYLPIYEKVAHRILLLVGNDQQITHIQAEDPPDGEESTPPTLLPIEIVERRVECPDGYFRTELKRNLRNARAIVRRASNLIGTRISGAVRASGSCAVRQSSWQALDADIVASVESLLEHFPPSRIKILVDPYLEMEAEKGLSADEFLARRPQLLESLQPIARAILTSGSADFWTGILQQGAELKLRRILEKVGRADVRFVYADGPEAHVVTKADIEAATSDTKFEEEFQSWRASGVVARGLLDDQVLADPFSAADAVLIYPSSLFVGLESDVVIYVRNRVDPYSPSAGEHEDLAGRIECARNQHHYMAASRARFHLLEITVD